MFSETFYDGNHPAQTKHSNRRMVDSTSRVCELFIHYQLGVSKNRGTSKSSILIGFSIINHPFWGTPIFGNTKLLMCCDFRWAKFVQKFSNNKRNGMELLWLCPSVGLRRKNQRKRRKNNVFEPTKKDLGVILEMCFFQKNLIAFRRGFFFCKFLIGVSSDQKPCWLSSRGG